MRVRVAVGQVPARTPADLEAAEQPDPVEQLARRSGEAAPGCSRPRRTTARRCAAAVARRAAYTQTGARACDGAGGAVDQHDVVAAGPQARTCRGGRLRRSGRQSTPPTAGPSRPLRTSATSLVGCARAVEADRAAAARRRRRAAAQATTIVGAWPGLTSKVDTTPRWSVGNGLATGEVDLRVAALADEPAVDRGRRARVEHPVDAVEEVLVLRLGATGRPGVAGVGHRVGVGVAVGVAEPSLGESLARRPRDGVRDLAPAVGHRLRPVEV